jgi:hypothetical protein
LIYGRGESPMAVLACALARREVGAFRWADGAPASERPEPEALRVLAEGSGQDPGWHVPPGDLDPPGISLEGLRHWLHSEAADIAARLRLEAYLRLPSILRHHPDERRRPPRTRARKRIGRAGHARDVATRGGHDVRHVPRFPARCPAGTLRPDLPHRRATAAGLAGGEGHCRTRGRPGRTGFKSVSQRPACLARLPRR